MKAHLKLWGVTIGLFLLLLYPTIYFHELGHAVAAYLYGCKADWWSTSVTPFLLQSSGGAIDYPCIAAAGDAAYGWLGAAGILINLVLTVMAILAARVTPNTRVGHLFCAMCLIFAAINFIEAFSYLTVNAIWPRSDMILVFRAIDVPHIGFGVVCTFVGLAAMPFIFRPLIRHLNEWLQTSRSGFPVAVMSLSIFSIMALGRMGFGAFGG